VKDAQPLRVDDDNLAAQFAGQPLIVKPCAHRFIAIRKSHYQKTISALQFWQVRWPWLRGARLYGGWTSRAAERRRRS
jgi:hypothetical protein